MKRNSGTVTLLALAALLAWCTSGNLATAQQPAKQPIVVNGATTVANLINPWLPEYEKAKPDTAVVVYGSTHGQGFKALLEKGADIAMLARKLSAEELRDAAAKGIKLQEVFLCNDAVAIVVNKENPVKELSIDQLKKIFSGEFTNWNQVGGANEPIAVVTLPPESGMRTYLMDGVLGVKLTSSAMQVSSIKMAQTLVHSRKGAIGYCRTELALQAAADGTMKPVAIKKTADAPAIPLTAETVDQGTFPIMRPLALCYNGATATERVRDFAAWCGDKAKTAGAQMSSNSGQR